MSDAATADLIVAVCCALFLLAIAWWFWQDIHRGEREFRWTRQDEEWYRREVVWQRRIADAEGEQ